MSSCCRMPSRLHTSQPLPFVCLLCRKLSQSSVVTVAATHAASRTRDTDTAIAADTSVPRGPRCGCLALYIGTYKHSYLKPDALHGPSARRAHNQHKLCCPWTVKKHHPAISTTSASLNHDFTIVACSEWKSWTKNRPISPTPTRYQLTNTRTGCLCRRGSSCPRQR